MVQVFYRCQLELQNCCLITRLYYIFFFRPKSRKSNKVFHFEYFIYVLSIFIIFSVTFYYNNRTIVGEFYFSRNKIPTSFSVALYKIWSKHTTKSMLPWFFLKKIIPHSAIFQFRFSICRRGHTERNSRFYECSETTNFLLDLIFPRKMVTSLKLEEIYVVPDATTPTIFRAIDV